MISKTQSQIIIGHLNAENQALKEELAKIKYEKKKSEKEPPEGPRDVQGTKMKNLKSHLYLSICDISRKESYLT